MHFCFTKIARDKTEKGKGGYWELSMNATKSEKKRIRNRRKHRDDCGRVYYSHRSRLAQRKNAQKAATMINSKPLESATKLKPTLNMTTNDSCNGSYRMKIFANFSNYFLLSFELNVKKTLF